MAKRAQEESCIRHAKILIVGTVQEDFDGLEQLTRIMERVYPESKTQEIKAFLTQARSGERKAPDEIRGYVQALKKLLKKYKEEEAAGVLQTRLPIEIYVDVPADDLAPLFHRCEYAFIAGFRGATFRNSGLSNTVAQGLITYTHIEEYNSVTPQSLKKGGIYEGAMIVIPKNQELKSQKEIFHAYQASVLEDIIRREKDPKLNEETRRQIQRAYDEVISLSKVRDQHLAVYARVGAHLSDRKIRVEETSVESSDSLAERMARLTVDSVPSLLSPTLSSEGRALLVGFEASNSSVIGTGIASSASMSQVSTPENQGNRTVPISQGGSSSI